VRFVRRALHLDSTTVSIVSSEKLDPDTLSAISATIRYSPKGSSASILSPRLSSESCSGPLPGLGRPTHNDPESSP
jgi:hypothetical protein